tara:strand:+ start:112 stop:1344 length:1233 start_codon:yes stop_codon:yes gene_type:complete
MSDEFLTKSIKKISSAPNWGHEAEIAFPGKDIEDFGVSEENINILFDSINTKIKYNHSLSFSRHGSLLSVNQKTRWTLDILSSLIHVDEGLKKSPPRIIEDLLQIFLDQSFFPNVFTNNISDKRKNLSSQLLKKNSDSYDLFHSIRKLMVPCCIVKNAENNYEIRDLFLPEITWHPIKLIREIFLSVLRPDYLNEMTDSSVGSEHFNLIPNFRPGVKLADTEINFKQLALNAREEMDSLLDNEGLTEMQNFKKSVDPDIGDPESRDIYKIRNKSLRREKFKMGNMDYPKSGFDNEKGENKKRYEAIAHSRNRHFLKQRVINDLSYFDQITFSEIDNIALRFKILQQVSKKAGVFQKFKLKNIDEEIKKNNIRSKKTLDELEKQTDNNTKILADLQKQLAGLQEKEDIFNK